MFTAILGLTGCQSFIKDIFEVAATPKELSAMSSIEVCKNLGYSQWRNQPQAYLDAKAEAEKRILAKSVKAEDCAVFSKMAIRRKSKAAASLSNTMNGTERNNKGCYWVCNNGEWTPIQNGICIMPIEPISLCM